MIPLDAILVWGDAGLLAQAAPEAKDVAKTLQKLDFGKMLIAASFVVVGYFTNRFLEATLDRFGEGLPRRRMFFKKVSSFARLVVFIVATYLAVATLIQDQKSALIGVLGTLGVAVGFALKDTISSVMAGILILVDQPFQVGDRVQFGETYGEVVEIGLRTVRINTLDDNLVSIPNNKFLTDIVASGNFGSLDMMVVMPFYIAVSEDADLAKRIVYEACVTSKYCFLEKPVGMRVADKEIGYAYATVVKCKAYVIDVRFEKAFITDVTERVKLAFRKHRIQSPYARLYSVRAQEWHDYPDEIREDVDLDDFDL